MPASSSKQKTLMCIAYSIKKGTTPASYSKEAAKLASSMSEEKLSEYCKPAVKK